MEKLTVPATKEQHGVLTEFIECYLTEKKCPDRALMEMLIAVDEIFSNIVNYGGASHIIVECWESEQIFYLRFWDNGTAFDPLSRNSPDVTLNVQNRNIGGLGIYMVKKFMTDMKYEYKGGYNILTIGKDTKDEK